MKQKRPIIKGSRAVEKLHHLRLMALLRELVRDKGSYKGAALMLEIDQRTVASSVKSGRLSKRTSEALERALQYGVGSAADEQRDRNDKLEARLDKTEGQLKEMKGDRRSGLRGLRMSLDGVRKYYGVQRRLIEQRLLVLEAGRDATETGASAGGGSGYPGTRSVAAGTGFPGKLTDPALAELVDAGKRPSGVVNWDASAPFGGDERADAPSEPRFSGAAQVSLRNVARSQDGDHALPEPS